MIWKLFLISLGLVSTQAAHNVEPEFLDKLLASGQDDKVAELLRIEKHLIRPDDSEQRSEGSKFNHASFLGDIVLTEDQERNAIRFDKYGGSRWPNGRIPYSISSGFDQQQKQIIQSAIDAFNGRTTNLQLIPRRWWHRDYVFVFSGSGCYSSLGKTGGQQALSLQKEGCLSTGTVQHEFLHAAGFTHEQNRIDRDNYVEVLWENIPSTWQSQYQKVNDEDWMDIGDYDYYSVMHYPIWAPETYKDAFKLPDGVDRNRLGQDDGVTDTDVEKINILYSK